MPTFVVIREAGPRWDYSKPLREQAAWREHAEFMDALEEEGFVVLGGPLAGGPTTLLVVSAASDSEIRGRLDDDPWTPMELLRLASVEPWEILLGRESIAAGSSRE